MVPWIRPLFGGAALAVVGGASVLLVGSGASRALACAIRVATHALHTMVGGALAGRAAAQTGALLGHAGATRTEIPSDTGGVAAAGGRTGRGAPALVNAALSGGAGGQRRAGAILRSSHRSRADVAAPGASAVAAVGVDAVSSDTFRSGGAALAGLLLAVAAGVTAADTAASGAVFGVRDDRRARAGGVGARTT